MNRNSRQPTLLERTSNFDYKTNSSYRKNYTKTNEFSSLYTNVYNSEYSDSYRNGRSNTSNIVRPSMRSRSTAREPSSRRITTEKTRDLSYSRTPQYFSTTPSSRTLPQTSLTYRSRPEFRTIDSTAPKKKSSSYDQNGRRIRGYDTPSSGTYVESGTRQSPVKRFDSPTSNGISATITTVRHTPTHLSNRTIDDTTGSSASSASSRRTGSNRFMENSSSSSTLNGTYNQNAGKVGLKNIGNTCFMNSIIQCLSNTRLLRDYFLQKNYSNEINRTSSPMKGKLVEAFSDILHQLWRPSSSSGSAVSTMTFKSQIQRFSSRFSGYDQQDSQEFLRFLIEGLHEDVNRVKHKHKDEMPNFDTLGEESKARKTWDFYQSKDNSFIVDLFMGQLKSSLQCQECKYISTTFDPFWDLSLPIPKGAAYGSRLDLRSCLETFTRTEILEGDERPTCEKCKCRRTMTKKFTIYRFPKILVIHLKRFNEGPRFRQKLSNEIQFPRTLEVGNPISSSSATFNLYAVSNHSGSCYGGHYTAFCKNPDSHEWHCFNDSLVSSLSSSSVQSKEAYVLFYESECSGQRSNRSLL